MSTTTAAARAIPTTNVRTGRRVRRLLLHAFLMFNREFEIVAFNSYLGAFHRTWLEEHMPLMLRNTGSLWLKRR